MTTSPATDTQHAQHPHPRVRHGDAALRVQDLTVGYTDTPAVEDVSFEIAAGIWSR